VVLIMLSDTVCVNSFWELFSETKFSIDLKNKCLSKRNPWDSSMEPFSNRYVLSLKNKYVVFIANLGSFYVKS